MTLIMLATLLLLTQAQAGQTPKSAGQQPSVEQVLSFLQSADPNRKGEALVPVTGTPALRENARVRQAVLGELAKVRVEYVNRHQSVETRPDHRAGELLLALIPTAAESRT